MANQLPAPGWYADPENPGQERRWTGDAWAEDRRPMPTTKPSEKALRADIQAAKDRMNVAWGGRRELRKLTDHLWHDKEVY